MSPATHVIVGASLAGASAAATLRKEGFDGRIVLVGEEGLRPYERPELSKKYLRGEPGTDLHVHAADFYPEAGIELLTGQPVTRIDPRRREVLTGDAAVPYDRLLLATGSRPRELTVPGAGLDGIVTLRTVGDADVIRSRALRAEQIVVVGGGWIGSEVAASLRQLRRNVTLLVPGTTPLERTLGPELGRIYAAAHGEHGVSIATHARVTGFIGGDAVSGVRTADGAMLPADLVVVGIGAEPRTELAAEAGIAVDDGIVVDERLETSVPGIFAAGDVANAWHPRYGRHLRVEHWDNAKRQGRAAAASLLGRGRPYDRTPYFYSDQYDLDMEYRGLAAPGDEVVFRGDPAGGEFLAFWLHEGRIAAAMNVNIWDAGAELDELVRERARVDRRALTDPARPLTELARAA
jgi:3-phenylpropionate/trans-cinnamate dioxygenase ferredoxin reductase subunit